MTATNLLFRLIAMVCHASYPLNSENASPPGTLTAYLLAAESCADMARPPRVASQTVAIPIVSMLMRFICDSRRSVDFECDGAVVSTARRHDVRKTARSHDAIRERAAAIPRKSERCS